MRTRTVGFQPLTAWSLRSRSQLQRKPLERRRPTLSSSGCPLSMKLTMARMHCSSSWFSEMGTTHDTCISAASMLSMGRRGMWAGAAASATASAALARPPSSASFWFLSVWGRGWGLEVWRERHRWFKCQKKKGRQQWPQKGQRRRSRRGRGERHAAGALRPTEKKEPQGQQEQEDGAAALPAATLTMPSSK